MRRTSRLLPLLILAFVLLLVGVGFVWWGVADDRPNVFTIGVAVAITALGLSALHRPVLTGLLWQRAIAVVVVFAVILGAVGALESLPGKFAARSVIGPTGEAEAFLNPWTTMAFGEGDDFRLVGTPVEEDRSVTYDRNGRTTRSVEFGDDERAIVSPDGEVLYVTDKRSTTAYGPDGTELGSRSGEPIGFRDGIVVLRDRRSSPPQAAGYTSDLRTEKWESGAGRTLQGSDAHYQSMNSFAGSISALTNPYTLPETVFVVDHASADANGVSVLDIESGEAVRIDGTTGRMDSVISTNAGGAIVEMSDGRPLRIDRDGEAYTATEIDELPDEGRPPLPVVGVETRFLQQDADRLLMLEGTEWVPLPITGAQHESERGVGEAEPLAFAIDDTSLVTYDDGIVRAFALDEPGVPQRWVVDDLPCGADGFVVVERGRVAVSCSFDSRIPIVEDSSTRTHVLDVRDGSRGPIFGGGVEAVDEIVIVPGGVMQGGRPGTSTDPRDRVLDVHLAG